MKVSRRCKDLSSIALVSTLAVFVTGCGGGGSGSGGGGTQPAGYPIDSTVVTTLEKTVAPSTTFSQVIPPNWLNKISLFDSYGYGVWTDGGPLRAEQRADLMPGTYVFPSINNPRTLSRFFSITDIHITDKESPSQLIYMQPANLFGVEASATSVYSPTMLYTTHVLDAAIQTVNALHKQKPIDFGISLGDTCNSTQYNELRWYIDVLDGKVITPSSGAHMGAGTIDYQKPYKAAGLNPEIPWYQAIGNHDHYWLGSVPPDGMDGTDHSLRNSCVSSNVLAMPDLLPLGNDIYNSHGLDKYYMGVIDGSTPLGDIIKYGAVASTPQPTVVADLDRRSLTKAQWANEFFTTTTSPKGHGLNLIPAGQDPSFGCYSFFPKSNIPVKVIVLDDTQDEDDHSISIHGHGYLNQARWDWLRAELAAGDAHGTDAGYLMIIAAHAPISVQKAGSFMEWYDNALLPGDGIHALKPNAVNLSGLLAELHNHPNLLMWIAGHRHVNTVKAFTTDNASFPERGFWQVETSSLHDFPQQLRTFDINLNSDYSVSIVTTNVDPAVKEGSPAATARKYAVAAQQIVNSATIYQADVATRYLVDPLTQASGALDTSIHPMPVTGSYNADLLKPLSAAMKTQLQTLFPQW